MKIVAILADRLFALHCENEVDNEMDRLLELWTDPNHLQAYAKRNHVQDIYGFIDNVLENAEELDDLLAEIENDEEPFGRYFQPLQRSEYARVLSFQKGKIRNNYLRLYALRNDDDCYLITGGAIEMRQKMSDHPDTAKELAKLQNARSYLNQNGVFDQDSFLELINQ